MKNISFEELAEVGNSQPLEITDTLKAQIQLAGENSFPDDEGITYKIIKAVMSNNIRFVEITANMALGEGRFVFELNADHSVKRCWDFNGSDYSPFFGE